MASARLADEVLTHMGDFLDDPGLCALACSERMRWDRSSLQRQTRKDEQLHVLLLSGRAECRDDCERAALQLGGVNVEPFLGECFWGGRHELDLRFHVEFCSSRRDLPLLCLAVETWLGRLQAMSDMHVLRETLTFHDEFTGDRLYDDGAYHRFDIPRRVFDKVTPPRPEGEAMGYGLRVSSARAAVKRAPRVQLARNQIDMQEKSQDDA